MMSCPMFILVLILAPGLVVAEEVVEEEHVLVLTEANFEQAIKDHPFILVEFYAPWCGHCKKLAPEYAAAAASLKEQESEVRLAKVDATVAKKLAVEQGVKGYPTLFFFVNGQKFDYKGGRTSDALTKWVKLRHQKATVGLPELATSEEAAGLMDQDEVVVVGLFKERECEEARSFRKIFDEEETFRMLIAHNQDVFRAMDIEQDKAVVILTNFDDKMKIIERENFDQHHLKQFIKRYSLPALVTLSMDTLSALRASASVGRLYFSKKTFDHSELSTLTSFCKRHHLSQQCFLITDSTPTLIRTKLSTQLQMEKREELVVRMQKTDSNGVLSKFKPENEPLVIVDEILEAFVGEVNSGSLEGFYLSEERPEDWDRENVKVVTGNTFEEVVLNKDKHVFLDLYVDACVKCKELVPVWDDLGDEFKDRSDLTIAKMDAMVNEVKGLRPAGYPTLRLFKKHTNEAIDFKGQRNLEELKHFLSQHLDEETKDEL